MQRRRGSGLPRVLITGGAGFLGRHLCKRYLDEGWEVLCLDNFYTGSYNNIYDFQNNANFHVIRHDVIEPIDIEVELILNFACPASPIHYQCDPVKTMKTSVIGTLNLLNLAKDKKARFLQASTSEVYGDPDIHPQKESYWGNVNPIGIRSCYDEGKRAAEALCFDFVRQYQLDVKVVRIFNTYGPFMAADDGRVISNFITQALCSNNLTIYGDGMQTRSFCFASDLIDVIHKFSLFEKESVGPINIGNDTEYTMLDVANKILEKINSESKIEFKTLPTDDPKKRKPDLTLARDILDWRPKISLDEGLNYTIDYFRKCYKS
ncbi:MAG: UDP-glucuronic acid decarboxylase family protein [Bdellovibrionota bacterium]